MTYVEKSLIVNILKDLKQLLFFLNLSFYLYSKVGVEGSTSTLSLVKMF